MLPLSVRRVVAAAQPAGRVPSLLSSSTKAAVAATPVVTRGHQRRCSSSKPSKSDNGASGISAGQSVPASANGRSSGKAAGEKRKRKNSANLKKLPSVPTTNHMSEEALGLSSFFSLHRPISITQTMPRSVTDEHFASIFAPRSRSDKMAEAMTTLADTIDQLDAPMAEMTISPQQDHGARDGMRKVELRNADGTESSIYLQVDTMAGDFLPFRPPPLPQSQASGDTEGVVAEAEAAVEEVPQHHVYKALFTIEESTDTDGKIQIVAHSPRIVNDEQPRTFLERLAQRQLKLDDARGRKDMHAISVKRQRKLKIKKKKYKKLMRRTRNLRRKLDRT